MKCNYLARRFYFIFTDEIPDREVNMQMYYQSLYPLMVSSHSKAKQNTAEQDMDFLFKLYSSTGWMNSTDLLDYQNDLDEEKYPELAA